METVTSPRHTRKGFVLKGDRGLLRALSRADCGASEIMDFSPGAQMHARARRKDELEQEVLTAKFKEFIARSQQLDGQIELQAPAEDDLYRRISALCLESAASCTKTEKQSEQGLLSCSQTGIQAESAQARVFKARKTRPLLSAVKVLSDGRRIEFFKNGGQLCKDVLGRVVEIYSAEAESLFIQYDERGKIVSFARTCSDGTVHSTGKIERAGVLVRDANGRVMAIGESMSCDPWGCFYLHTRNGQYFSIDLVSGMHGERRRFINANGEPEYLTAVFSADGFRMASSFARCGGIHPALRSVSYRFYGRDGSMIEFASDQDLQSLSPATVKAPATVPVHRSWMCRHQAQTAWDSVKEYLSKMA